MRRIDLFCKLIAPVFISLIDGLSTSIAIWTVLGMNSASVVVEYLAIAQVREPPVSLLAKQELTPIHLQVYRTVPALRKAAGPRQYELNEEVSQPGSLFQRNLNRLRDSLAPWKEYAASRVFLASLALSMLYLTVLSFAATMVTYLVHSGFNSLEVSCMRIGAVTAELSGTWAAPLIMGRIGPIRSGLWFLNWQFCCLAGATAAFIFWDSNSRLAAGSLIIGVALSRIGLWGFDLSVQFLVQEVSLGLFLAGQWVPTD